MGAGCEEQCSVDDKGAVTDWDACEACKAEQDTGNTNDPPAGCEEQCSVDDKGAVADWDACETCKAEQWDPNDPPADPCEEQCSLDESGAVVDTEGCEACKAEQGTENTNAPAPAPWDTGNEYAPAPVPGDGGTCDGVFTDITCDFKAFLETIRMALEDPDNDQPMRENYCACKRVMDDYNNVEVEVVASCDGGD